MVSWWEYPLWFLGITLLLFLFFKLADWAFTEFIKDIRDIWNEKDEEEQPSHRHRRRRRLKR